MSVEPRALARLRVIRNAFRSGGVVVAVEEVHEILAHIEAQAAQIEQLCAKFVDLRRRDAAKLGALPSADLQGRLMLQTRLRAINDCINALHHVYSKQPVQAMGTGVTGDTVNAEQGSTALAGEKPALKSKE